MPSKCYESHLKSAKWPTSTIWSWSSTVSRVSGPRKNSPSCGRNPQSHTLFRRTRVLIGLNIPRSSRVKLGKQFSFGFALCLSIITHSENVSWYFVSICNQIIKATRCIMMYHVCRLHTCLKQRLRSLNVSKKAQDPFRKMDNRPSMSFSMTRWLDRRMYIDAIGAPSPLNSGAIMYKTRTI